MTPFENLFAAFVAYLVVAVLVHSYLRADVAQLQARGVDVSDKAIDIVWDSITWLFMPNWAGDYLAWKRGALAELEPERKSEE